MSARFVIGRAGSGKTRHCFEQIVKMLRAEPLGGPIWWVLPKQATFMAERELTCASGLAGFGRARVVSFDVLGEHVLDECGGGAVPQVTAAGRRMILGHLLRRHEAELKFFKSSARQAGLAAELDATFDELERCGKNLESLDAFLLELSVDAHDPATEALRDKFADLRLIYRAYCAYLGQDRLDPHLRLQQVLTCIESCRLVQGAQVFVDGYYDFTQYERRVLASIAKACQHIDITILMDPASPLISDIHQNPEEMGLFFKTEDAYRRLWFALTEQGVKFDKPLLLTDPKRFENRSLAYADKHLFARRTTLAQESDGIEMIEAPDRRLEVDAAARAIRDLLKQGQRLRDIGVLVRDLDKYHELIDASFREHGIAYFADRRRTAGHHPLPQVVRSIVLLALHNWPHDAVMTMLKSGLCRLSLDQADDVENYVLLHRIRGEIWASNERWPYKREKTRRSEEDLAPAELIEVERIDGLRRTFVAPLASIVTKLRQSKEHKIRDLVQGLFEVLEQFGVRKTMAEWMRLASDQGDLEQRGEHEQVWVESAALFQQMIDVMGDESVALVDFLQILDSGLSEFDLALAPATLDQVLVGSVERTRTPPLKSVIVLGLSEGEFPRAPGEKTLLSDGERQTLRQKNIEIDPDGKRRLLDEAFLGYIAFTRAAQKLIVTRPAADDEARPLAPSSFWWKIAEGFPQLRPTKLPREAGATLATIGTPRQLVTALMNRVRAGPSKEDAAAWAWLYECLATHECGKDDAMDVMRRRAWRALKYDNKASLSNDLAEKLFPAPLRASVSQVETFAACPFKHFARYGLALREREDEDVTAIDLGNIYHGILENLVRQIVDSRADWASISEAQLRAAASEIGNSLRGELMLSNARNQYLLRRIEKTMQQIIASQSAAAQRGGFRPKWAELKFGPGNKLGALVLNTPAGKQVQLSGKIDRVDILEKQAAVAVVDYKLSKRTLPLDEVYHGLSLQLLTYLLVLQANGEQLAGRKLTPAAAFYVRLLRQLDAVKHPSDARGPDEPGFDLRVKPRGVIDRKYLSSLDSQLKTGKSEVVNAMITKDGQIGVRKNSDLAEANEFEVLLNHVRQKIAALADEILAGKIEVHPYRVGQVTPCPRCEYRSVCRFETPTNEYRPLLPRGREWVLNSLTGRNADGD